MDNLQRFWRHHARALGDASCHLLRKPLSSLCTLLALGISLTFPLALWLLSHNVHQFTSLFPKEISLSVFLRSDLTEKQIQQFVKTLEEHPEIERIEYLSSSEALEELSAQPEFQPLLSSLPENPLPGVVTVIPKEKQNAQVHEQLYQHLRQSPSVELVMVDTYWLQKLQSWITVFQNMSLLTTLLLSAGMILLIANSIRLALLDHQQETQVLSLIGASNALIRRPFLYRGFLLGSLGSLCALSMIAGSVWLMGPSLNALFALYDNGTVYIASFHWSQGILALILGGLLGWFAAFCAVQPELHRQVRHDPSL